MPIQTVIGTTDVEVVAIAVASYLMKHDVEFRYRTNVVGLYEFEVEIRLSAYLSRAFTYAINTT